MSAPGVWASWESQVLRDEAAWLKAWPRRLSTGALWRHSQMPLKDPIARLHSKGTSICPLYSPERMVLGWPPACQDTQKRLWLSPPSSGHIYLNSRPGTEFPCRAAREAFVAQAQPLVDTRLHDTASERGDLATPAGPLQWPPQCGRSSRIWGSRWRGMFSVYLLSEDHICHPPCNSIMPRGHIPLPRAIYKHSSGRMLFCMMFQWKNKTKQNPLLLLSGIRKKK